MTAEPPGSPVAEGVRSLEVRGIFPDQPETAVAGWFGRASRWRASGELATAGAPDQACTSEEADAYLAMLGPDLAGPHHDELPAHRPGLIGELRHAAICGKG